MKMDNEGVDQTVWMLRLNCTFVAYIEQNQVFSWLGPFFRIM